MNRKSLIRGIRIEYLSLAIALLIVGLMTSTPLNLDFSKSYADFEKMGVKTIYLLLGGFAVAYLTAKNLSKISHIAARFIASAGIFLIFYPFLSLVSAIEKPSGWMVIGVLGSVAIFSFVIADLMCAKYSNHYKETT